LLRHNAELAIGLAVVMVVLLAAKAPLHHLSREVMTKTELDDALRYFVIAFVVLPVVPDRNVGPYGMLNPSRIWVLVVALTGINWAGYIAVRALGPRRGLLVTGLAGGFISATATTASLGRRARGDPSQLGPAVGGALLASAATLIQLALVTDVANRHLFARILPALAVGLAAIAVEGGVTYRSESIRRVRSNPGQVVGASEAEPSADAAIGRSRPLRLVARALLAGVLTVALLVARSGAEIAGSRGALLTSGLAGFADVHAAVVAAATLAASNSIMLRTAMIATTIALAANTAAKCALAFGIGGRPLRDPLLRASRRPRRRYRHHPSCSTPINEPRRSDETPQRPGGAVGSPGGGDRRCDDSEPNGLPSRRSPVLTWFVRWWYASRSATQASDFDPSPGDRSQSRLGWRLQHE